MIRLTSFLWLWFQCVCPLATPTILLGFLLPWAWGISARLLQQSAAIAPYLGWGVSPHRTPSWPSTWDSSSRPSCARPRSQCSSGVGLPLASGAGWLLLAAPGLGLGVTSNRVCLYSLLSPEFVISDKDVSLPSGIGRAPFTWEISST